MREAFVGRELDLALDEACCMGCCWSRCRAVGGGGVELNISLTTLDEEDGFVLLFVWLDEVC